MSTHSPRAQVARAPGPHSRMTPGCRPTQTYNPDHARVENTRIRRPHALRDLGFEEGGRLALAGEWHTRTTLIRPSADGRIYPTVRRRTLRAIAVTRSARSVPRLAEVIYAIVRRRVKFLPDPALLSSYLRDGRVAAPVPSLPARRGSNPLILMSICL